MRETMRRAKVITKLNKNHIDKFVAAIRNATDEMKAQVDEKVKEIKGEMKVKIGELREKKI